MKMQRSLINLVLVVGLFFTFAFARGDDRANSKSTPAKNQDQGTINQTETEDKETANETENQNAQGPRLGKYTVMSYGNPSYQPLQLGHFELLAGGKYKSYLFGGQPSGEGKYSFDAATSNVKFLSGKFKNDGWGGGFKISREGKTHTIRLYGRGTFGTNSTDNP